MGRALGSAPDPFRMPERLPPSLGAPPGFQNTHSRVLVSSVVNPVTDAIVLTIGQSLLVSSATGTYTPVNALAHNFNPYDGGIYQCLNPILGPSWFPTLTTSNGVNIQIADKLIISGLYTRVIMVPIAVGGTLAAEWTPAGAPSGQLNGRIVSTLRRLAVHGLTPTYIIWQQGQADSTASTSAEAYATNVRAVVQSFRDNGANAPFFVGLDTMLNGVTSPTIRAGQAAACSTPLGIFQGADWDTLDTSNRWDGTHFTGAGALAAAQLVVDKIVAF